jgi:hypothetical protein
MYVDQNTTKAAKLTATLWADSTYGYIVDREKDHIQEAAQQASFPLEHWTCVHGCGLCTKGNEGKARPLQTAPIVIIEMGYNDDDNMNSEAARENMQMQTWFQSLKANALDIRQVIFIDQPTYFAATGKQITAGRFTQDAVILVEKLNIAACRFRADGNLYAGMLYKEGFLCQDPLTCKTYQIHGKYMSKGGNEALWIDEEHPSSLGAVIHFKCLAAALLEEYKCIFEFGEFPCRGMGAVLGGDAAELGGTAEHLAASLVVESAFDRIMGNSQVSSEFS